MSTPSQPPNYHLNVGGTLVVPQQPDVMTYPLRQDQFETLCEGEMSTARSTRDACFGAFLTGAVGIIGIFVTIDWDEAVKLGRHPYAWTFILCLLTGLAIIYLAVSSIQMWRTKTESSYSRLVEKLRQYFGLGV